MDYDLLLSPPKKKPKPHLAYTPKGLKLQLELLWIIINHEKFSLPCNVGSHSSSFPYLCWSVKEINQNLRDNFSCTWLLDQIISPSIKQVREVEVLCSLFYSCSSENRSYNNGAELQKICSSNSTADTHRTWKSCLLVPSLSILTFTFKCSRFWPIFISNLGSNLNC